MDEMVRTRLLLLAMAGLLLVAGGWIWTTARNAKDAKTSEVFDTSTPAIPAHKPDASTFTKRVKNMTPSPVQRTPSISDAAGTKPGAATSNGALPQPRISPPMAAVDKPLPAIAPVVPPAQPVPKGVTPATSLQTALSEAKSTAGHRDDPYKPIKDFKPFPRFQVAEVLPPPPKAELVPPPPPSAESALGGGLTLDELPPPPEKPSVAEKMKLIAIVGDKAILSFPDVALRQENNWPKTLTLGAGEKFESVSVVDVSPDSITLDEDGERSVKSMDPIK